MWRRRARINSVNESRLRSLPIFHIPREMPDDDDGDDEDARLTNRFVTFDSLDRARRSPRVGVRYRGLAPFAISRVTEMHIANGGNPRTGTLAKTIICRFILEISRILKPVHPRDHRSVPQWGSWIFQVPSTRKTNVLVISRTFLVTRVTQARVI